MQELWNLLRSPRHVMVFEAAARHGSFTRAAEELNVRQPAVSATIAQLEDRLGVALFTRQHRRVTLTAAGARLFADVGRAFELLQGSAHAIRHRSRSDHVTLNASSAFNFYWMMPRLADLHERHPGIDLRLQTSDFEPDIDAEGISLAVRRGNGQWPGCAAALIAPEEICPVASPQVMAEAGPHCTPRDLLAQRLIHLEEPVRARPTWADWFAHFGLRGLALPGGLRLNDYALVLQAALAGEGIAFGWRHVTERLVQSGQLAARRDLSWRSGYGFYLVWSKRRPLGPAAAAVRDWVLQSSAQGH